MQSFVSLSSPSRLLALACACSNVSDMLEREVGGTVDVPHEIKIGRESF